MKGNEIINCIKNTVGIEHIGIYCTDKNGNYTTVVKVTDILDIFDRQNADIKALINGQETLQKHFATQNAIIKRLQNENAELQRKIMSCNAKNKEYPFKCKVGNNSEIHSKTIQDYDRLLDDIATEAIKEFWETLYEKIYGITAFDREHVKRMANLLIEGRENGE